MSQSPFANCRKCVYEADYKGKEQCETSCSWSDDLTPEESMNCQKQCDAMANESVAECYQQGLCCPVGCSQPTSSIGSCDNFVGKCMSQEQECEALCDDNTQGYWSCLADCRLDRSQCVRRSYQSEQCCPDVCQQPPTEPPCRCRQTQQPYRVSSYRQPSYRQPYRESPYYSEWDRSLRGQHLPPRQWKSRRGHQFNR